MWLKWLLAALLDSRVQGLLLGIIERAVGNANERQLEKLRADLGAQTLRLEHRISEMEDRIQARLDDHERRLDDLENDVANLIDERADDLPGDPPPLPEKP